MNPNNIFKNKTSQKVQNSVSDAFAQILVFSLKVFLAKLSFVVGFTIISGETQITLKGLLLVLRKELYLSNFRSFNLALVLSCS